jgi:hypothetical protein
MFDNCEVLGFGLELLIRVNSRTKHLRSLGSHLTHLLRHLICSLNRERQLAWSIVQHLDMNLPLSLPRMKLKTDCSPKMHRKYQLMLDIQRGSMSLVATPA